MINDNRYYINSVIKYVDYCIESINKYRKENVPKIVMDKINIVYPSSQDLTSYVDKGTCKATIKFNYHTELNDQINKKKEIDLVIPLLIDGIYVIDGKCRLPLNYMINDNRCLIKSDRIIFSSSLYLSVANGLKIAVGDGTFTKVDYDTIDPEVLKLTDYDSKKLGILFNIDPNPEYLTKDLVDHIRKNFNSKIRDNSLNKRIMTPEMALLRNIGINQSTIASEIRSKYYNSLINKRKDPTGTLYLKTLQNAIDTFFRGADKFFTGIQNPTNSNPLIFESMKSKIILENDVSKIKKSKIVPYTSYNMSFYGIIDPVATPDNSNSSRVNELTRCVNVRDGETYIKCYDKSFNRIEVPFIDYLSSKVLLSEEVDYDFREIKSKDKYKVKFKDNLVESDDFDLIEIEPDYRLSLSTSQIPMINLTDSTRVEMGSKMINQAIEVTGAQKPIISSGNDCLINNPLIIKFEESVGEVIDIDSGVISIKLPDGSVITKSVPKPIKGMNKTNILFDYGVDVGDKVYRGDILIKPSSLSSEGSIELGVNARVAAMTYRGYNFEDGVIVSESFAKKMTSISVEDYKVEIDPDTLVEGFLDVGSKIDSNSVLIEGKRKKQKFSGITNKSFIDEVGLNKKFFYPWKEKSPIDVVDGVIYDLRIFKGDVKSNFEETDYIFDTGRLSQYDRSMIFKDLVDTSELYNNIKLISDTKATKGSAYTVIFRIIVKNKLKLQDKVTNRYGSKGVVSLILPDDKMPYDKDHKPIEVIMNPDAPLSRKNISQTIEQEMSLILSKLFKINQSLILGDNPNFEEARNNFKTFKMPNYYKMTDEELIDYHLTNTYYEFITGSFSKINPKDVIEWEDKLGVNPNIELWDGETNRKIRNPILVGNMYLLKLHMLSDAYAKVTSEKIPGVNNMVLNKGSITKKGSKHGNMELDAIISSNSIEYAKRLKSTDGSKAAWMLANAILTGLIYKTND